MSEDCRIFLSHTKLDREFCDKFDNGASREGIISFRSEFEKINTPAWKTIKDEIELSSALFLLVGKELIKAQKKGGDNWKYTQNWISYEIGIASECGIDVWVWCEDWDINFPIPYLNNYVLRGFGSHKESDVGGLNLLRYVLRQYKKGVSFPFGWWDRGFTCPYENCSAEFNLHTFVNKGETFRCPTCLRKIIMPKDWLIYEKMSFHEIKHLVDKWGPEGMQLPKE